MDMLHLSYSKQQRKVIATPAFLSDLAMLAQVVAAS
jgi:hypothetical protein